VEENPESEEIEAHDEQRNDASTIRETVPTNSSSATEPLATSQNPLERRVSRTHAERGAHSSSTQVIHDSRPSVELKD